MQFLTMSQKIAKHRANDASSDVHGPPLLSSGVIIHSNLSMELDPVCKNGQPFVAPKILAGKASLLTMTKMYSSQISIGRPMSMNPQVIEKAIS